MRAIRDRQALSEAATAGCSGRSAAESGGCACESALLTDLYQLQMMQAYLDHGKTGTAVFEFFMRKLPPERRFLMAAGLEQALGYLEGLRFSASEIEWLAATGRFRGNLLDYLAAFRFAATFTRWPKEPFFSPTSRSFA